MSTVFAKEFKQSMRTMTAPIFIAFMLFWFGVYTSMMNLEYGYSQFEYTVRNSALISMLALPLLTMRTFAEERRNGSDKLLYSLPVKTWQIIAGKFLSALAVFAIPVALIALYPLVLSRFGVVYLNTAYSTLLAYFLIGAALIAIGTFISSLTESQVIAAVFSLGVIILLNFLSELSESLPKTSVFSLIFLFVLAAALAAVTYVLTKSYIASAAVLLAGAASSLVAFILNKSAFEGLATRWITSLDLFKRMNNFLYGKLDVTAVIYFISITFLFLFLTAEAFEKRRWN